MTLKQAEEFCLFHTFESFQALTFTKSLFNTRIFIYFFHENKLHPIAVRKLRNWNLSHSTQAASSVNMKERQKDFTFCDGVERWSIPALHSTTVAPGGLEPLSPFPLTRTLSRNLGNIEAYSNGQNLKNLFGSFYKFWESSPKFSTTPFPPHLTSPLSHSSLPNMTLLLWIHFLRQIDAEYT